jgi:hypothetical protein
MRIYRLISNSGRFYSKRRAAEPDAFRDPILWLRRALRRRKDLAGNASVLTVRQKVSGLAHPVLNLLLYATRVAKELSLVHGLGEVHLTKKPRAKALGVIVDSDLKIES